MGNEEKPQDDLSDYDRGYVDGLRAYAWWRDGTEYVGTCGTTLKNAIEYFVRARKKARDKAAP